MIKAVFFAYAHTLVEVRKEQEASFMSEAIQRMHDFLTKSGYEVDFDEFKRVDLKVFGEANRRATQTSRELNIEEVYSKILGRVGIEALPKSQMVKRLIDTFFRFVIDALVLCPHAESTLKTLKKSRFKVGIIANYPKTSYLKLALERLKIEEYFDSIVTSADVGLRKPRREIFEKALESVHIKPWEAVMVGSSLREDIGGAETVGMKSILLSEKKSRTPNITVQSLSQILDIISKQ